MTRKIAIYKTSFVDDEHFAVVEMAVTRITFVTFRFENQNTNGNVLSIPYPRMSVNKLCAWRHNMPPTRPADCTHAVAHLQSIAYTAYACGAQLALLHEYS